MQCVNRNSPIMAASAAVGRRNGDLIYLREGNANATTVSSRTLERTWIERAAERTTHVQSTTDSAAAAAAAAAHPRRDHGEARDVRRNRTHECTVAPGWIQSASCAHFLVELRAVRARATRTRTGDGARRWSAGCAAQLHTRTHRGTTVCHAALCVHFLVYSRAVRGAKAFLLALGGISALPYIIN